jgi:thymidylate synthase
MGSYYEIFGAILRSRKEIIQSVKKLDPHLRKTIQVQFPKINQLCRETKKCILKIQEIEKVLFSLEAKQESENKRYSQQLSNNPEIANKMRDSKKRYYENIQAIQLSKNQHIQQIQQVLQLLQELNSQILALRYSHSNVEIGNEIAETIDELLTEIKTLEEIR